MMTYLVVWDYKRCLLPIPKKGNQVLSISFFVVGGYRASLVSFMSHKMSRWSKAFGLRSLAPKGIALVELWIFYSFKIHLCVGGMCRVM